MHKSDFFQDRKCIYPNKLIFFITPPFGSECKLCIVSFSKLSRTVLLPFLSDWLASAHLYVQMAHEERVLPVGRECSPGRSRAGVAVLPPRQDTGDIQNLYSLEKQPDFHLVGAVSLQELRVSPEYSSLMDCKQVNQLLILLKAHCE